MARQVEGPWYRASKDTWYATHEGRKVSLGVKGKGNRKEALAAWANLLCGSAPDKTPRSRSGPTPPTDPQNVRELVSRFLSEGATRFKSSTLRRYREDLSHLVAAFGKARADRLTPSDLTKWLAAMTCCPTTKAVFVGSVSSLYGWAVRCELVSENPARKVSKPKSRSRGTEAVISDEDHAKLLAAATPDFALVLRVLHATGCRPGEAAAVTAENFDAANAVVTLRIHKTDASGRPRLIFLPPDVVELLERQRARWGTGSLLRSRKGVAWNGRSITKAMQRLKAKAGVQAMAYGYRHTYATAALANAIPDATVAALLGHTSTAMLHKHYAHLTAHSQALREAASKVRR